MCGEDDLKLDLSREVASQCSQKLLSQNKFGRRFCRFFAPASGGSPRRERAASLNPYSLKTKLVLRLAARELQRVFMGSTKV
jgi:hypothetical protein